jgi:catechol 2,3-dioxygenase
MSNNEEPQIGHVHLKVTDLERSIKFYHDVLDLRVTQRNLDSAAFLSFDNYHHHLGLNTWMSKGGSPSPRNSPGLFHFAVLYPTRKGLASALARLKENRVQIDGAADHGVSEAIYFHDPDGNGIEIYWDRPESEWPRTDGKLDMVNDPLDLDELLTLA